MTKGTNSPRSPQSRLEVATPELSAGFPLHDFLAGIEELTHHERARIVQQAIMLLESLHVNLPLKCAMYAVDPLRRLRLLQQRLPSVFSTDWAFHREMTQIFNSLNDLHTNYFLPEPFSSHTAWLPFAIEFCNDGNHPAYLATKVRRKFFSDRAFRKGVEILAWNGVPIDQAVALFGAQSPSGAGNPAARHALGLQTLTLRPLSILLPPDEDWVIVGYRSPQRGRKREIRVPWRVSSNAKTGMDSARDSLTRHVQKLRRLLFARGGTDEPEARKVNTPSGTFGYLRIFTFDVPDAGQFIEDIIAKIAKLPQDGLIVDVRSNAGGKTAAAERLLQLFAPDHPQIRIEPARLCLINTPRMLQFCKLQASNAELAFQGLKPWIESVARAMETGAPYSASFPITDPDSCNAKGRLYPGPVIVITDGMSRSAAEVFAAGFQDHGGKILGVDKSTGGAGASVRRQSQFKDYFKDAKESPFINLPKSIDFSIPFRRFQRVRRHIGSEIEDFGVVSNYLHTMTRNDVLNRNVDLINKAASILSKDFGAHKRRV